MARDTGTDAATLGDRGGGILYLYEIPPQR
nr:MAG TPA: hypothetical protein [Caudoviricetes sp.]